MATVTQVLEKHFLSFLDENGLESLKEKMIEVITKCEYELDDVIDDMVYNDQDNACIDLENEVELLNEEMKDLEKELESKDKFFEPETLQDKFKIQWIKDNWNKIPTV